MTIKFMAVKFAHKATQNSPLPEIRTHQWREL